MRWLGYLTVLLIALRLLGLIAMPWLVVLSPVLIVLALAVGRLLYDLIETVVSNFRGK